MSDKQKALEALRLISLVAHDYVELNIKPEYWEKQKKEFNKKTETIRQALQPIDDSLDNFYMDLRVEFGIDDDPSKELFSEIMKVKEIAEQSPAHVNVEKITNGQMFKLFQKHEEEILNSKRLDTAFEIGFRSAEDHLAERGYFGKQQEWQPIEISPQMTTQGEWWIYQKGKVRRTSELPDWWNKSEGLMGITHWQQSIQPTQPKENGDG